ncbi:hypothetical protein QN395_01695 [Undibacterium sp. RTI2.2]|nr:MULTISPECIES: hypothetical protein [unclassified Undibacterium]MDY7537057.1 hypothetical protein [Undibacterium sp. 5I1]MEB0115189.1 hypothetical protein [Undibacterium sp. RTI2.2]MEB0229235.1 hypothetical protein [Undibacterium sp. 10I3]MEB0256217.1 hypothetical protein [Undibacterium sp. 5I1]
MSIHAFSTKVIPLAVSFYSHGLPSIPLKEQALWCDEDTGTAA